MSSPSYQRAMLRMHRGLTREARKRHRCQNAFLMVRLAHEDGQCALDAPHMKSPLVRATTPSLAPFGYFASKSSS